MLTNTKLIFNNCNSNHPQKGVISINQMKCYCQFWTFIFILLFPSIITDTVYEIKWEELGMHDKDVVSLATLKTIRNEHFQCYLKPEKDTLVKQNFSSVHPFDFITKIWELNECLLRIESYWIYRYCHGSNFIQYHDVKKDGIVMETEEYILGRLPQRFEFLSANNTYHVLTKINIDTLDQVTRKMIGKLVNALNVTVEDYIKDSNKHFTKNLTLPQEVESIKRSANVEIIRSVMTPDSDREQTFLRIRLDPGSYCAQINKVRQTHIYYFCDADNIKGFNAIQELSEVSICEYRLYISTPLLCDHPDFAPLETKETIYCFNNKNHKNKEIVKLADDKVSKDLKSTEEKNVRKAFCDKRKHKPLALREWEDILRFQALNTNIKSLFPDKAKLNISKTTKLNNVPNDSEQEEKNLQNVLDDDTLFEYFARNIDYRDKVSPSPSPSLSKKEKGNFFESETTPQSHDMEKFKAPPSDNKNFEGKRQTIKHDKRKLNALLQEIIKENPEENVIQLMEKFYKSVATSWDNSLDPDTQVIKANPKTLRNIKKPKLSSPDKSSIHVGADLLLLAGESCIRSPSISWWSYEFCMWSQLTQFATQESDIIQKPSLINHPTATQSRLGYQAQILSKMFNTVNDDQPENNQNSGFQAIVLGRWDIQQHLNWIVNQEKSHLSSQYSSNNGKSSNKNLKKSSLNNNDGEDVKNFDGAPSITYFYGNGDVCEKTGIPRNATITLKCLKTNDIQTSDFISFDIDEPITCSYKITIVSPFICKLLLNLDNQGLLKAKII